MSPLTLFLFVLIFVSLLLLWSVVFQHDRELQQFRSAQQVVHIYQRPFEVGEPHPFAPDATVSVEDLAGGHLQNQPTWTVPPAKREVVESTP